MNVAPTNNVPIGTINIPNCNGAKAAVTTLATTIDNK